MGNITPNGTSILSSILHVPEKKNCLIDSKDFLPKVKDILNQKQYRKYADKFLEMNQRLYLKLCTPYLQSYFLFNMSFTLAVCVRKSFESIKQFWRSNFESGHK